MDLLTIVKGRVPDARTVGCGLNDSPFVCHNMYDQRAAFLIAKHRGFALACTVHDGLMIMNAFAIISTHYLNFLNISD